MPSKTEENWQKNYEGLCEYIALHGHLPDKHKVEFRALLNWTKYRKPPVNHV